MRQDSAPIVVSDKMSGGAKMRDHEGCFSNNYSHVSISTNLKKQKRDWRKPVAF